SERAVGADRLSRAPGQLAGGRRTNAGTSPRDDCDRHAPSHQAVAPPAVTNECLFLFEPGVLWSRPRGLVNACLWRAAEVACASESDFSACSAPPCSRDTGPEPTATCASSRP